jgi:NADH-quinone oxidoreductase subunit C
MSEVQRLMAALGGDAAGIAIGVTVGTSHTRPVLEVPPDRWREAVLAARDVAGRTFFDWLTAVDELDAGFGIVTHLWNPDARRGLLLRTRVPRENPRLASIADVFAGADWSEREAYEMFGVVFHGRADLRPLLLPAGVVAFPLRKDRPLAARADIAEDGPGERG